MISGTQTSLTKGPPLMPVKDPSNYPFITYLWVVGLSAWGSIVSFLRRASSDLPLIKKVQLILAEITISTFAGMITFFLCEYSNLDKMLSAALIAISGHMGTRAVIMTERLYVRFINRRISSTSPRRPR